MRHARLLRLLTLLTSTLFAALVVGTLATETLAQAAPSADPNVRFEVVTTTTTTTVPVTTTTVTHAAAGVPSSTRGPLPFTGAPLEQWLLISFVLVAAGTLLVFAAWRRRVSLGTEEAGTQPWRGSARRKYRRDLG